ncbi:type II secretion system protein [Fuchsiella alkaliacetigena]|uniref:type II secretion system protein n=1 Tax=Fuchsiella alkaliacetigena TaxID=957042 RepID=UPI00200B44BA|nr:type II secretion system protein [Fuchsiella alkaliacetigena]MCK8825282.1 type II secretion system GspH family protein [Fuchsiella alkaliacetigena]
MLLKTEHKCQAFVLAELLMVLSIIGILITGFLFISADVFSNQRLEIAAGELLSDLRKVRYLAISEREKHGLEFDFDKREYVIYKKGEEKVILQTKKLESGIKYGETTLGGNKASFSSEGTANSGSIYLSNNARTLKIVIFGATGRIRLEEVEDDD